jgi:hypothetical protein
MLDPEAYAKTLWDYAFTNGCFPRGIRATDIDFMVEINGHFLFGEFQKPNKQASKGQRLALARLAQKAFVTVFRVIGYPPAAVGEWSATGENGDSGTGTESFLRFLREWVAVADGVRTQDRATQVCGERSPRRLD